MAEYIEREAVRNTLYEADVITMNGLAILNRFPAADVVSMEVHRQVMAERDLAIQQLREDYGVSLGEKKAVQYPCRGCVYFKECGDNMRTMPCAGRLTKRQMAQTRNGRLVICDLVIWMR